MAVSMSNEQRKTAAALLRERVPAAAEIGRLFASGGHELALVGGLVRDVFLGQHPEGELDLATDATPDQVLGLVTGWADKTWTVGIAFGTVGLRKGGSMFEVTTYRSEQYDRTSRKPDVQYGRSLEEDLARRDFTINAMAARLPGYEFTDPYRGLDALREKVLRTPGPPERSFSDDPLRILRAARFAASLGFTVAPEVRAAMTDQAGRLEIVSAERIQGELSRLLVAPNPSLGLGLAVETGLAEQFLPELPALRLEQDPVQRHKDVLRHTLAVVDGCEPDLRLRLAALLHDIGKPGTRRITEEGVTFHHHEMEGARMAAERLRALRYPGDVVEDVTQLVEMHLRFHSYKEGWSDSALRRYVRDAGPMLDRLNALVRADCTTQNPKKARFLASQQDEFEVRLAALAEAENLRDLRPPLDGNEIMEHLGIPPGPMVGRARDYLLDLRLERGPIERRDALKLLDEWAAGEGLTAGG